MFFITLAVYLLTGGLTYALIVCLYNAFLHPLSRYPGPMLAGASHVYWHFHTLRGTGATCLRDLHSKYGPIVRFEPTTLSFIDGQAGRDILGAKANGKKTNRKISRMPSPYDTGEVPMVVLIDDQAHHQRRKVFSSAFSDQALRSQHPLFLKYVDLLVSSLKKRVEQKSENTFNLVDWLTWTTFDVMGDLTFAEPLGLLDKGDYVPWVRQTFMFLKAWSFVHVASFYPPLALLLNALVPASVKKEADDHRRFSEERVDRRLEKTVDRRDIWGLVLQKEGEGALNRREMYEESKVFLIGGTETTATALSSILYNLGRQLPAMARLRKELEEAFACDEDITGDKLRSLPYLNACVEEGLRMLPPVPVQQPRELPDEGAMIGGERLPGRTLAQFSHFAAYRSEYNFALPDEYHPERWLKDADARFAQDQKDALLVFSYGPRNCIGKNMAYYEMRLILAKLILNFDFELSAGAESWLDQKSWVVWDKPPLNLKLKTSRP